MLNPWARSEFIVEVTHAHASASVCERAHAAVWRVKVGGEGLA